METQSSKDLDNELSRLRRDERAYYDQVKTNTLSKFGAPTGPITDVRNSRVRTIPLTPVGVDVELMRRPRSLPELGATAQEFPGTGNLSTWKASTYKRPSSSMIKKDPLIAGHPRMWVGQVVREAGAVNINDPAYLSVHDFYLDQNKVETSTMTYAPIIAKSMQNMTTRADVNTRQSRNKYLSLELVDKVNQNSDLDYVANPYPRSIMTPDQHRKTIGSMGIAIKNAFQQPMQQIPQPAG